MYALIMQRICAVPSNPLSTRQHVHPQPCDHPTPPQLPHLDVQQAQRVQALLAVLPDAVVERIRAPGVGEEHDGHGLCVCVCVGGDAVQLMNNLDAQRGVGLLHSRMRVVG